VPQGEPAPRIVGVGPRLETIDDREIRALCFGVVAEQLLHDRDVGVRDRRELVILAVDALAPPGRLLEQRQRLTIAALRVAQRAEVVGRIDVERVAFAKQRAHLGQRALGKLLAFLELAELRHGATDLAQGPPLRRACTGRGAGRARRRCRR